MVYTIRLNKDEEDELARLETYLRRLDPSVTDRSKVFKTSLKMALYYIENSYFSKVCITPLAKPETAPPQTRFIERISSDKIGLDGERKDLN